MKTIIYFVLFLLSTTNILSQTPYFQWNNKFNGSAYPHSISQDQNNNLIIAGEFGFTVDFDPGPLVSNLSAGQNGSIFIQKLDSSGNLIWVKKIDNQGEYIQANNKIDVITDLSGNIFICSKFRGTVDFDLNNGIFNLSSSINSITSEINTDIFIAKYSPVGDLVWVKNICLDQNELRIELFIDNNNLINITGDFGTLLADLDPGPNVINYTPFQHETSFILKLDQQGNHVFSNICPINSFTLSDQQDHKPSTYVENNGSFYFSGNFQDTIDIDITNGVNLIIPAGLNDGVFAKYDASGQLVWYKVLNSINQSSCFVDKLVKSNDGFLYVIGLFDGSVDFNPSNQSYFLTTTNSSFFCAKYSGNGDFIWAKQLPNIGSLAGFELQNLQPLTNGNVVLTLTLSGYYQFDVDPGNGSVVYSNENNSYGVMLVLDQNGDYVWSKQYEAFNEEVVISDLYVTSENEIFFCGEFGGIVSFDPSNVATPLIANPNSSDGFVVKYKFNAPVGLDEIHFTDKKILKIYDLLGREVELIPNQVLIFQYSDGTIERKFVLNK